MRIRIGRIIGGAFLVEVLAILTLTVIVALSGFTDADEAAAYAERIGYLVGPIAGFVFCFVLGWWVARGLASGHLMHGLLLGAGAAAIDIAILVASGAAFEPVFVISNAGRLAAGALGGWLAGRSVRARVAAKSA
ncbi:MAG: hypothetical protein HKN20_08195 [Gemmatimonadetes bacterium]|nr:hypothetical protein [Gemmatimonadota bacterium]